MGIKEINTQEVYKPIFKFGFGEARACILQEENFELAEILKIKELSESFAF